MTPRRWIPITILLGLMLAGNGYSAIVVWTFTAGQSTVATIDHCWSESKSSGCDGTWVDRDGQAHFGDIADATSNDEGKTLPIRVGPFGAYKDSGWTLGFRMLPAGLVDSGLILAAVLTPIFLARGRRAVKQLRDEATPGSQFFQANRKTVSDDGGPIMTIIRPDKDNAELHAVQGLPLFTLKGLKQARDRTIFVSRADGRAVGRVWCRAGTTGPSRFLLSDPAGLELGGAVSNLKTTGFRYVFTAPNGAPLASFAFTTRLLMRVEPGVSHEVQALLWAFAVSHDWLTEHRWKTAGQPSAK